jgi:hypothetical protein
MQDMASKSSREKDDDGLGVLADSACDAGSAEPPAVCIIQEILSKSSALSTIISSLTRSEGEAVVELVRARLEKAQSV